MSVEDKLIAIAKELSKETFKEFFPPAAIIINAIESETNKVRQENMKQMIDKAIDELLELKDLLYKEMNAKENQMIHQIMQNVGDEFEFDKRDAYAYVLVNVMKQKYDKRIIDDIIFQLQNLSSYDLNEFKKLYESDIKLRNATKDIPLTELAKLYGLDPIQFKQIVSNLGVDINSFELSGKKFNFNDLHHTTFNKLEYVGLINVPRYVKGEGDLSSIYKPSLTHESKYLYEVALTPPK